MARKITNWFRSLFEGGDDAHETLKRYNYKPEKGHIAYRDGGFVWVIDHKATWQIPKDETGSQI